MNISPEFDQKMNTLLGEEAEAFFESLKGEKHTGLRVNPRKVPVDFYKDTLEEVPWAKGGYYTKPGNAYGKHPYHGAGVYYIQEPSAMLPAMMLSPKPGERVLDLCASPGGKSTQLEALMGGEGLLVSNEINPSRAKVLSQNMERWGASNVLVLNENPAHLESVFPNYFDKILVDAPCSGEGMFRKESHAALEWTPESPAACAHRQKLILESARKMLRPGGRLCYSTCTFSPEENEQQIADFLKEHPDFRIVSVEKAKGVEDGRPQWADGNRALIDCARIFPHLAKGEGHFAVLLERSGDGEASLPLMETGSAPTKALKDFYKENLREDLCPESIVAFGETLYAVPKGCPSLRGLKVLRAGLELGTERKGRFVPSHALALALKKGDFQRTVSLTPEDPLLEKYLSGETIPTDLSTGWGAVCVDEFPIGWGKAVDGVLKNHYPKGLRLRG